MKTTKHKLNVRLLRRIQRHILEEPRRFFMEGVIATGTPGKLFESFDLFTDLASRVPACGTAACIHGWTALLSGKTPNQTARLKFSWSARKLGLPENMYNDLFIADYWPEPFNVQYIKAERPSQRAKIAAARIEHLITTGE